MVSREGLAFTGRRVLDTFKLVLKNKMALVGFALMTVFVVAALAAPLISPTSPTVKASGNTAMPEWTMNFADGYYLSKNIVVVQDPYFNSPSSIQSWTLDATPSSSAPTVLANTQLSYAPGIVSRNDSKGSMQLTYTGTSKATVRLYQVFNFPYRGPPNAFTSTIHYLFNGVSPQNPALVRLYIERLPPSEQMFYLYRGQTQSLTVVRDTNVTDDNVWLPRPGIILASETLQAVFGTGSSSLKPADIVFSTAQDYAYGVEITFYGPARVNIDDFQLKLYGTAWGLLGTDNGGYDIFALTVYGARISLMVGLLSAGIGIGLGLVIGLLAGFMGKFVDEVLMRFTDMMLVIPSLPLLIVLVAVLGPNIWNLILVIGFLGWMGFARIVRSQVLTIRERPFVEAARASGAGPGRIIVKHVFPNLVSLTYVNLALTVPAAILSESALAFLGLSDPTVTSWGHMFQTLLISGDLVKFPPVWWWVLPPGFGIALISLSFILIGYALDEIFNPRLRKRR